MPIAVEKIDRSSVDLTHGLSNDDVISDLTFNYMSVSFEKIRKKVKWRNDFFLGVYFFCLQKYSVLVMKRLLL